MKIWIYFGFRYLDFGFEMWFTPDIFVSIINQYLPEPHASLLAGMLFGHKYSKLPYALYQALIVSGTLHVVALSGTNVTILIKLISKLTFPLSRLYSSVATLATIAGFVLLVGFDPPIVRAAIMGGIATFADLLGRRSWAFFSLLFASGVMMLIFPEWLYSLSFQLSFLATLGIIVFDSKGGKKIWETGKIGIIKEIYLKARVTLIEDLRTTLAAQVFITPLLIYSFGRISFISPMANALSLWSVQIITPLGLALVLSGIVFWPLAKLLSWVVWVFLEYFILIVLYSSLIPFASIVI